MPLSDAEPSNAELEEASSAAGNGAKRGQRDLSSRTYDHIATGRQSVPSRRTSPAASGRSRHMSLTEPARRRDGSSRSWTHDALVSLPARTASPAVELTASRTAGFAVVADRGLDRLG